MKTKLILSNCFQQQGWFDIKSQLQMSTASDPGAEGPAQTYIMLTSPATLTAAAHMGQSPMGLCVPHRCWKEGSIMQEGSYESADAASSQL